MSNSNSSNPNSPPPSYISFDNEDFPLERLPSYKAHPRPPTYDPIPTHTEEAVRAFMAASYPNAVLGGPSPVYIQQRPNRTLRESLPKWPTWVRSTVTLLLFIVSFTTVTLPLMTLAVSPVSELKEPYLYELNNINMNLSTFAHHVNITELKATSKELISVPDFIRIGLHEYCTDDDPLFSNGRCGNYHKWNDYGSLQHIYSVLVTEATGKKLSKDAVLLPSPESLATIADKRDNLSVMVAITLIIHFLGLPCIFMISISDITNDPTGNTLARMLIAAGFCLTSLPFSIAASCLVTAVTGVIQGAFSGSFDKFGVAVNPGHTLMAFCYTTAAIDAIMALIGVVLIAMYYKKGRHQGNGA